MFEWLNVFHILVLVLAVLLVAWVLAVWLPVRDYSRGSKLFLAALFSFMSFALATALLVATGAAKILGIPNGHQ